MKLRDSGFTRLIVEDMPQLADRLRRIRRLRRAQREATLRSVLPWAVGDELEAFAAEALEHAARRPSGSSQRASMLISVLRAWQRLSGEARSATVAIANGRLPELLGVLASSDERSDRRAASACAGDCLVDAAQARPELEPDLVLLLHRLSLEEGRVAHEALDALAGALRRYGSTHERLGTLLDAACADAVGRYDEHRHHAILRAVADEAGDAGPRLRAWLDQRDDAGHMAMRSAERQRPADDAIGRAVSHLGIPALAPAAVRAIESVEGVEHRSVALSQAHLLSTRSRVSTLGRLRRFGGLLGETWDDDLPLAARRGMVRWIASVPMKPKERAERLAGALGDGDAGVRLSAVLALRAEPASPTVDAALRDYAFDADERVAHAALSTLATAGSKRRREAQTDLFEALERSGHDAVRTLAQRALSTLRVAESDDETLRAALVSSDRAAQLDALVQVDRRSLAASYSEEIIALVDGPDPYVASRATLALTRAPDQEARLALLGALGHPDGRVVASAVEALGRRDGDAIRLDAFETSSVARVRANALRHGLGCAPQEARARDALASMLIDPRASHRLSALWLTERSARTDLAERVAQLVREDESPEVRARAERCAGRLLATMRTGWAKGVSA